MLKRYFCRFFLKWSEQRTLEVKSVKPGNQYWGDYLMHCRTYFNENWPQKYSHFSPEQFNSVYGTGLTRRFDESNRGLFLYFYQSRFVGLSNVYIDLDNDQTRLNIAEFYISPPERRQGFARMQVDHLIEWGKAHGAQLIRAEVDKDLPDANLFWHKMNLILNSKSARNEYSAVFTK